MKKYLSFGCGVNSMALLLMLQDAGEKFEPVFCDLGLELPETYKYLQFVQREVATITIIPGRNERGRTLYEHCLHYQQFPTRRWKWCADKFKIKPIHRFYQKPCVSFLGIAKDEEHRPTVIAFSRDGGIDKLFPLIEAGIDRAGCVQIIRDHGLPIPPRSGCYICASQRKPQWQSLYRNHPELYEQAKHLEQITNERLRNQGKRPRYFRDMPLQYLVGEDQLELKFT